MPTGETPGGAVGNASAVPDSTKLPAVADQWRVWFTSLPILPSTGAGSLVRFEQDLLRAIAVAPDFGAASAGQRREARKALQRRYRDVFLAQEDDLFAALRDMAVGGFSAAVTWLAFPGYEIVAGVFAAALAGVGTVRAVRRGKRGKIMARLQFLLDQLLDDLG